MAAGFIFSNDPGSGFASYDDLKRRQALVDALAAKSLAHAPRNVGEGLTAVGRALAYRMQSNRLAKDEAAARSQYGSIVDSLLGARGGAGPAVASTAPATPSIPSEALSGTAMSDTAVPLSGGTMPQTASGGSPYAKAIASLESEGSGGYSALGPVVKSGDRAYGKYQVMGANIPEWTKEVLGRSLTPEQFLAAPQAQDAVFNAKFGSYVQKYGHEGAAKAWFAGEGGMNNPNARDVTGTSVAQYAKGFLSALGPSQAQAAEAPNPNGLQYPNLYSQAEAEKLIGPVPIGKTTPDGLDYPNTVNPQELAFNGKPVNANPLADMSAFAPSGQAAVPRASQQGGFAPPSGPAPNITTAQVRPTQLPIGNQAPVTPQAAPQAGNSAVANAIRQLSNSPLPQARSLAGALLQQYLQPHTFGFQALPDGTIVRTDSRAGTVTPVFQGQGEKPTSDIVNYHLAQRQGYKGTFAQFQTDMKNAGRPLNIGSIPAGYQLIPGQGGAMSLAPIPGGPVDQANKQKEESKRQAADLVVEDINRGLKMADNFTTGPIGTVTQGIPGTQSHDLQQLLQGIKANVGFDRLQQMRQSSPTGGALGQVSEQENRLLQSTMGSLEQSQTKDQFTFNMKRLHNIYMDTINGTPAQLDALLKGGRITQAQHDAALGQRYDLSQSQAPAKPAPSSSPSIDDLLKKYGGAQ